MLLVAKSEDESSMRKGLAKSQLLRPISATHLPVVTRSSLDAFEPCYPSSPSLSCKATGYKHQLGLEGFGVVGVGVEDKGSRCVSQHLPIRLFCSLLFIVKPVNKKCSQRMNVSFVVIARTGNNFMSFQHQLAQVCCWGLKSTESYCKSSSSRSQSVRYSYLHHVT